jgi:hypothetical protein
MAERCQLNAIVFPTETDRREGEERNLVIG